jgi:predicted nucleic acid-binding protein
MAKDLVVDASALIDLFLGGPLGETVLWRLAGNALHSPAHLDAEVLSAVGHLEWTGALDEATAASMLERLAAAPIERHPVGGLLAGAWERRAELRLADALYVELAQDLGVSLVTTDVRFRKVPSADVVFTSLGS